MEANSLFSDKPSKYEGSHEVVSADLSYGYPSTDVSMDRVPQKIPHYPLQSVKDGYSPIEFLITPDLNGYTDLKNTQLSLLARIVRQDGTFLDENDIVSPCNLFFQHLFSHVIVYINNVQVMNEPSYPMMAHITRLLGNNPLEKQHILKNEMWYQDKYPDTFTLPAKGKPPNNFLERYSYAALSYPFALLGNLIGGVFSQTRLFPPNTEIRIILKRNIPELMLNCAYDTKAPYSGCPYKVFIEDPILWVAKKTVTPSVLKMHEEILTKETLKFPILDRQILTFGISEKALNFTTDTMILPKVPRLMVVGLVSQAAWLGKMSKSPYNFQSKQMTQMSLTWSGDAIESRTINYAFGLTKPHSIDSILLALDTLKDTVKDPALGNGIDRENYELGK